MSRSKRAPYWTEGYKGTARKKSKQAANKAVRRDDGNKQYKKIYSSWDIVDYKFEDADNPKVRRK